MPIRAENKIRYPVDWPEISARIRFVRAATRRAAIEASGQLVLFEVSAS